MGYAFESQQITRKSGFGEPLLACYLSCAARCKMLGILHAAKQAMRGDCFHSSINTQAHQVADAQPIHSLSTQNASLEAALLIMGAPQEPCRGWQKCSCSAQDPPSIRSHICSRQKKIRLVNSRTHIFAAGLTQPSQPASRTRHAVSKLRGICRPAAYPLWMDGQKLYFLALEKLKFSCAIVITYAG